LAIYALGLRIVNRMPAFHAGVRKTAAFGEIDADGQQTLVAVKRDIAHIPGAGDAEGGREKVVAHDHAPDVPRGLPPGGDHHAAVLAAVKNKPCGWPPARPFLTAEPPPLKWSDSNYGYFPMRRTREGKRHKPEEIVSKLRQVDVLTGQGSTVSDAVRQIGVTEYTYYRWRKEYGGLQTNQVKRIKDLEQENARLRKAVSDLTLDKLILQEASKGNY
jgi:transposase-like protein